MAAARISHAQDAAPSVAIMITEYTITKTMLIAPAVSRLLVAMMNLPMFNWPEHTDGNRVNMIDCRIGRPVSAETGCRRAPLAWPPWIWHGR